MEEVMVTLDAMTAAVEAVEAMVTAVDMLDCLAPGKPESDREAAASFFQESLEVSKGRNGTPIGLYWPGRLPGLLPLLTDCLLPHNSKTTQSAAMHSIKYLSQYDFGRSFLHHIVFKSDTPDKLIDLACSTKYPEIRDQVVEMGDMAGRCVHIYRIRSWLVGRVNEPECLARFQRFLPVLVRMLQEPDNRDWPENAKEKAIDCLRHWSGVGPNEPLFHSGAVQALVEMLREGKETEDVFRKAVYTLGSITVGNNPEQNKMMLEAGVLAACHQILKGYKELEDGDIIRDAHKYDYLAFPCWTTLRILFKFANGTEEYREAILSQEGLVNLVLEKGLDQGITHLSSQFHVATSRLLWKMVVQGSGSLVRRLVSKELLLRLLAHHLNAGYHDIHNYTMEAVQAMLGLAVTTDELRLWRRLFDDFGITDAIRRISLTDQEQYLIVPIEANPHTHILARNILDTYFNNPLPPPPPTKLPLIIYTKNAPY